MEHCPNCGTDLLDGAASFCTACGSTLQAKEESCTDDTASKSRRETQKRQKKPRKRPKPQAAQEIMDDSTEEGYDGYYNDVLPPDWDQIKDGLDKELIRKVIVLIASVILIISMCVVLLFIL